MLKFEEQIEVVFSAEEKRENSRHKTKTLGQDK